MKKYNVAILGATGAVGQEMLKVLEEYDIPVGKLLPLASAKSAGGTVRFKGEDVKIEEAREESFEGMDFVLGAVKNPMSRRFAPAIVKSGAVYIDNSSAFRMDPEVPLVVPEINGEDAFKNKGIIANPNCSSIITLMAVAALAKLSPIKSMIACTYQAVSGAGQAGLVELESQMLALAEGKAVEPKVFPAQIAMNVIPHIGDELDNLYTDEEMKMQNEGRRILHAPELAVTCTCVRVPVMRSHSISVTLRTERKISVDEARDAIRTFPGVRLIDDYQGRNYPTPLDTSNQDLVWVGRVREDLTDANGLTLWCCGDQIRKGAASNAVQILKKMIEKKTALIRKPSPGICPGDGFIFHIFRRYQQSCAPAGTLSSSMMRCSSSFPSISRTADRSMPLDICPIILRGGRLRIATTVLPTSCSGS